MQYVSIIKIGKEIRKKNALGKKIIYLENPHKLCKPILVSNITTKRHSRHSTWACHG